LKFEEVSMLSSTVAFTDSAPKHIGVQGGERKIELNILSQSSTDMSEEEERKDKAIEPNTENTVEENERNEDHDDTQEEDIKDKTIELNTNNTTEDNQSNDEYDETQQSSSASSIKKIKSNQASTW